jgi:hypothetical protein
MLSNFVAGALDGLQAPNFAFSARDVGTLGRLCPLPPVSAACTGGMKALTIPFHKCGCQDAFHPYVGRCGLGIWRPGQLGEWSLVAIRLGSCWSCALPTSTGTRRVVLQY